VHAPNSIACAPKFIVHAPKLIAGHSHLFETELRTWRYQIYIFLTEGQTKSWKTAFQIYPVLFKYLFFKSF